MTVVDLGLRSYAEALEFQTAVRDSLLAGEADETLILVEHPPVVTLGAAFQPENLRVPEAQIEARGIGLFRVGRGGDVTVHEPGQLVAYPIFDLSRHTRDLHVWMRTLEEASIQVGAAFGVELDRVPGLSGAWSAGGKVAAVGVQVRRWVTMHGLALNCDNDLATFGWVVPCGISDRPVSTLTREAGRHVSVAAAKPLLVEFFAGV